jgi:glycosyltransferase involved in cell wall biosynthesis
MYIKGFDQLIEAFGMAKLDDTDLIITGDGPEKGNLTCLAYNLGLRDRVIFAGAQNNLQDYYSQAEMFVLPSRNEGYPNALVEAMSFGCPCIAMNCEFGPAEIIIDHQNGLLVPAGDKTALSNAINTLAGTPYLRKFIGANAAQIKDTNSKHAVFKKWDSLILKHFDQINQIKKAEE